MIDSNQGLQRLCNQSSYTVGRYQSIRSNTEKLPAHRFHLKQGHQMSYKYVCSLF